MSDRKPDEKIFAPISRLNMRGRPFGPAHPGKPFKPGQGGRPKGARNKSTTMLARLFDGEAEEIGHRAIELAKEGRLGAIRLVLDRACPARKSAPVDGVILPAMTTAADAVAAMSAVVAAVAAGTLAIDEARDLSVLIDNFRKVHELADIERRMDALERRIRDVRSAEAFQRSMP